MSAAQTTGFAHAELPLEVLASTTEHAFQRAFAHEAVRALGAPPEGVAYEPDHAGLRVYAGNEMVLAVALARIRAAFGERVAVEAPQVRFRPGGRIEEPVMDLDIRVAPECAPVVRADLQRRGAELIDVSTASALAVIRARVPLQQLMGYPDWLAAASDGSARLAMWLDHYRPVGCGPDPEAA